METVSALQGGRKHEKHASLNEGRDSERKKRGKLFILFLRCKGKGRSRVSTTYSLQLFFHVPVLFNGGDIGANPGIRHLSSVTLSSVVPGRGVGWSCSIARARSHTQATLNFHSKNRNRMTHARYKGHGAASGSLDNRDTSDWDETPQRWCWEIIILVSWFGFVFGAVTRTDEAMA